MQHNVENSCLNRMWQHAITDGIGRRIFRSVATNVNEFYVINDPAEKFFSQDFILQFFFLAEKRLINIDLEQPNNT